MAFSTLTLVVSNNTPNSISNAATTTVTLSTSDLVSAKAFCQNIPRNGGVFDDSGIWVPSTAILKVSIS